MTIVSIKQYHYLHVLDTKTNVTRCLEGPMVYTAGRYEKCLFEPKPCIVVPPQHYCTVANPCVKDAKGNVVVETSGQVHLRLGEAEIRFERGEPFPLYPGEHLVTDGAGMSIHPMPVVGSNEGVLLRCLRDHTAEEGGERRFVSAGTEWVVQGYRVYKPRVEVEVVAKVAGIVVPSGSALRLRAAVNFTDRNGTQRYGGDQWLVRTPGVYVPAAGEQPQGVEAGRVLNSSTALHLTAVCDFTDVYGVPRREGETWMVTKNNASVHIPDVYERVVCTVEATTLAAQQYCVVHDPVGDDGRNRRKERVVMRGPCVFFLRPGESIPQGVESATVVRKDEALLLRAIQPHTDDAGVAHIPGSQWILHGPCQYIPAAEVCIVEHRRLIALDKNEGIYVMNTDTGEVRAVIGTPYMPAVNEVLWEKHLPSEVEELLACPSGSRQTSARNPNFVSTREKHRIVRFNVAHNAAVQIYDYHNKRPRIQLGPSLVMLAPHEEFTVLSLSGGAPKVPNALQSLQLFLGPRFSSDTIVVETCDHARLRLRLSYNWYFDVDRTATSQRIFSVPDFIGDCCKTIASRVRGAVAGEDFDSFHRNSAKIIRMSVFGLDEHGEINNEFRFPANNFVVTNIDVQSVEPTDEKTRSSLQKSVQLAIEITAKSQEAAARHGSELKDQEAKGKVERRKLLDKIEVEVAKTKWLELQAKSEAVQASGQSVAEAKAKAEALLIEVNSELEQAKLRAESYRTSAEAELQKLKLRQSMELDYVRRQYDMDVVKAKAVAEAEADKVKRMVDAIGRDTLIAIARAGPETQAKLLSSLGLKGYLITDGNSPVNLFGAAQGMLGASGGNKPA